MLEPEFIGPKLEPESKGPQLLEPLKGPKSLEPLLKKPAEADVAATKVAIAIIFFYVNLLD
jgi:hypothetical protein